MLKKQELEDFMIQVPPHHHSDPIKIRKFLDLLNTEPRTISYLSNALDWNLPNVTRFLQTGTYKDYVMQVGSVGPNLWRLREDEIRKKIIGYDVEVGREELARTRDLASSGHSFDPVPPNWFNTGFNYYPYFPRFREAKWNEESKVPVELDRQQHWGPRNVFVGKSERWPLLNQQFCLDPFVTVCYIMTNAHGSFKTRLRAGLEENQFIHGNNPIINKPEKVANVGDVMIWGWIWMNLRTKNYTFFERDFSYLPSLWSHRVQVEYGLLHCVEFISDMMELGPPFFEQLSLNGTIEDLWDEDA